MAAERRPDALKIIMQSHVGRRGDRQRFQQGTLLVFVPERHRPGGVCSVDGQAYGMLLSQSSCGKRCCQNDAMFLG